MKKVPLPEWCVSVKKAMVERDDMSASTYAAMHTSVKLSGSRR